LLHVPRKVDKIGIIDFAGTGIVRVIEVLIGWLRCVVSSEIAGGF
jgi:hypothetical protein